MAELTDATQGELTEIIELFFAGEDFPEADSQTQMEAFRAEREASCE